MPAMRDDQADPAIANERPRTPSQFLIQQIHLCLESSWESSHVVLQLSVVRQELNICTINQNSASSLLLHIFFTTERSETPVLGNDDLLATRELVLGSSESLESDSTVW